MSHFLTKIHSARHQLGALKTYQTQKSEADIEYTFLLGCYFRPQLALKVVCFHSHFHELMHSRLGWGKELLSQNSSRKAFFCVCRHHLMIVQVSCQCETHCEQESPNTFSDSQEE